MVTFPIITVIVYDKQHCRNTFWKSLDCAFKKTLENLY